MQSTQFHVQERWSAVAPVTIQRFDFDAYSNLDLDDIATNLQHLFYTAELLGGTCSASSIMVYCSMMLWSKTAWSRFLIHVIDFILLSIVVCFVAATASNGGGGNITLDYEASKWFQWSNLFLIFTFLTEKLVFTIHRICMIICANLQYRNKIWNIFHLRFCLARFAKWIRDNSFKSFNCIQHLVLLAHRHNNQNHN